MSKAGPLIVQGDLSVLADVHDPEFAEARDAIGSFASLEKSPEHIHTYRISPLSLWNAAAAGLAPREIVQALERYSRYDVPGDVKTVVTEIMSRFGALAIKPYEAGSGGNTRLSLACSDEMIARRIRSDKVLGKWLAPADLRESRPDGEEFFLNIKDRGTVKVELMKRGWPVRDEAPLAEGKPLDMALRPLRRNGSEWGMRLYQSDAVQAFLGGGKPGSGYGVVVLPCGSGKTIVGMAVMSEVRKFTLIVTTNIAAVHQWIAELLDKTTIDPDLIGEYTGAKKEIKPVTVATYQILTWRPDKDSDFPHFDLFRKGDWGLVICDEVHLLPAPVFRVVAEIQAVRRLGLTATLVREDGKEEEVFSLIGPKRYDVPWKDLERKGFIAQAWCKEIRVDMDDRLRLEYAVANPRQKIRIAAENGAKERIVAELISHHEEDSILVIGQYISQLERYSKLIGAPLITGATPEAEREKLYGAFKDGEIRVLVVSRVANFAIDLPDASVAVQISGSFGSRQEEAQRLGRILRPKRKNSFFYSLVSRYTVEEDFAMNRRRFLIEQGYAYTVEAWE